MCAFLVLDHNAGRRAFDAHRAAALRHDGLLESTMESDMRANESADNAFAIAQKQIFGVGQLHQHYYFVVLQANCSQHHRSNTKRATAGLQTHFEKHEIFRILCDAVLGRRTSANAALSCEPRPTRKFCAIHTSKWPSIYVVVVVQDREQKSVRIIGGQAVMSRSGSKNPRTWIMMHDCRLFLPNLLTQVLALAE